MTPALAALGGAAAGNASAANGEAGLAIGSAATCAAIIPARILAPSTARARDAALANVHAAECRHRLPTGLLDALVLAESAYRPRALSRAGAVGLAQLMPGTAGDLGVANRRDAAQSIEGGAIYLRQMIDRFGEVRLALAAYNAGPSAVRRAGGVPDNGETPGYVARVVRLWQAVATISEPGATRPAEAATP